MIVSMNFAFFALCWAEKKEKKWRKCCYVAIFEEYNFGFKKRHEHFNCA